MQTYAVVDCDFKFVKIGRTTDLEARLSTLNTASPRDLVLMALFNGDIEQEMHRRLQRHRQRLEWFRYNTDSETTVIAHMMPTKQWFVARKAQRLHERSLTGSDRFGPVDVSTLSIDQRDAMCRTGDGPLKIDALTVAFGIPSEDQLSDVIRRGQFLELKSTRALLGECRNRVTARLAELELEPSPNEFAKANFALAVIRDMRRRVGMEIGATAKQRRTADAFVTISGDS